MYWHNDTFFPTVINELYQAVVFRALLNLASLTINGREVRSNGLAVEVKVVRGYIKDIFTERGSHAERLDNFVLNYGYPTEKCHDGYLSS